MTFPNTEIDKIGVELHELAEQYAAKADALANDPYFREALIKVSVSSFAWALYHRFDMVTERTVLDSEMQLQSAAISRAISAGSVG
jgi:hypothetical protein